MSLKGFEPPTHGLEGRCSIQLSYRLTVKLTVSPLPLHQRRIKSYHIFSKNASTFLSILKSFMTSFCLFAYLQGKKRAGDGNRTHVSSLEGWCSTIELHPHTSKYKV